MISKNLVNYFVRKRNHFFIMHFNVRSLPKNIDHLVSYLAELSESPDIIAVTETKLNSDTVNSKYSTDWV